MARKGDGLYQRGGKGGTWWLDFRHDGQRHVKRLGKGISRSVARELASVERAAMLKGEAGIGKKKKDCTFDQAAAAFLKHAQGNMKPNTYKDYALCVKQLNSSFCGRRLSEISAIAVERHKQMRKDQGAKVRANRELAVLKNLFNCCRTLKLYEGPNPVNKDVKFLPEPKCRPRFLEPEEEQRILEKAPEPLRTMILIAIDTGLRIRAELLKLTWEHVDFKRKRLTVDAAYAKNGEVREVPLNSSVLEALLPLRERTRSKYVFAKRDGKPYDSIRNVFEIACRKAKLLGVTPHTLRHTFASRLVMAGVDVRTIQELGGWKQLRMIERYGHVNDRHKAEAVQKLVEFHNAFHNTEEAEIAALA